MKPYIPKNKEIENLMRRISRDGAAFTSPRLAMDLCRNKKIRELRRQDKLFVGRDYRKHKSILFYHGKIRVDETGVHFD